MSIFTLLILNYFYMKRTTLYLSIDNFNKELENDLTIISYPSKYRSYYYCRTSSGSFVNVYIIK